MKIIGRNSTISKEEELNRKIKRGIRLKIEWQGKDMDWILISGRKEWNGWKEIVGGGMEWKGFIQEWKGNG